MTRKELIEAVTKKAMQDQETAIFNSREEVQKMAEAATDEQLKEYLEEE